MRKIRILLFCLWSLALSTATAQHWQTVNITGSLMQYAMPASEFAGLFVTPLHPKCSMGVTYQWNKNPTHRVLQNAGIGFGYHRFVQSILPLNIEIGYRYQSQKKIFMNVFFGGGYLHSFPLNPSYVLKNGVYERTGKFGRPQGMINARIGLGYLFKKMSTIEISYENLFQTPFVNIYIPFLPYNIFNITYAAPFTLFKNKVDKKTK